MAARATRYIRRYSPTFAVPTLSGGRPVGPWQPTSVVREDWAKPQLIADPRGTPVDLTQFRDLPFELRSRQGTDPGGDALLEVAIPGVGGWEATETGALAWTADGTEFKLAAAKPGGGVLTLFEGLVENLDHDDGMLVVTCIGANFQINDYVRAPGVDRTSYDIGEGMVAKYDPSSGVRPGLHTDPLDVAGGPVGISTSLRGAWEREWDAVQHLQSLATTDSGTDQWTLSLLHPWTPQFAKRSTRGVVHTVTYGSAGVRFSRSFSEAFNVIYGYGQSVAGEEWRNMFVGDDGTIIYQPLAFLLAAHGYLEGTGPDLGRLVPNPDAVDTTRRRERVINFQDVSIDEARALCEQYLARDLDPGWVGTADLIIDPRERSRFEILEGDTLRVLAYVGSGITGVDFHIAAYDQSGWDTMRLTCDTKARDLAPLEEILKRNRTGNTPNRGLRLGRTSGQTNDKEVPWDVSNGAGWLPRERAPRFNAGVAGTQVVALTGGAWNVFQTPAGERGTIGLTEVHLSVATEFACGVFDWAIDPGVHLPVNPLTSASDWTQNVEGALQAWGNQSEPAGYWHSTGAVLKSAGAAVSGVLKDDGHWDVTHSRGTAAGSGSAANSGSPALLWWAIFPTSSCNAWARLELD